MTTVDTEYWQTRQCQRCQVYYNPRLNIGTWQCRVHPVDLRPASLTHGCCDVSMRWAEFLSPDSDRLGCTPIDHDVQLGGDEPMEVAVRSYSPAAQATLHPSARGRVMRTMADYLDYLRHAVPGQSDDAYRHQLQWIQTDALNEPRFYLDVGAAVITVAWRALWQARQQWDIDGQLVRAYPPNPVMAMGPEPGTAQQLVVLLTAVRQGEDSDARRRHLMRAVVDAVRTEHPGIMPITTMVKRMADRPTGAILERSRMLAYHSLYTTA